MAEDDSDLELDLEEGEAGDSGEGSSSGSSKKMMLIIAAVVLLGGGAAAFFLMGDDSSTETAEENTEEAMVEKGPAIYIGVPNAITANLPGERKNRTVQIKISFLVRSDEAKQNIKQHMPQLKNDMLMLVSQKNADELMLPEGRQKLQQEALATVQETLTQLVDDPTVEKVLFVSFVMQ